MECKNICCLLQHKQNTYEEHAYRESWSKASYLLADAIGCVYKFHSLPTVYTCESYLPSLSNNTSHPGN